jgi:hypothetical protein
VAVIVYGLPGGEAGVWEHGRLLEREIGRLQRGQLAPPDATTRKLSRNDVG